jgi:hypothetical protein
MAMVEGEVKALYFPIFPTMLLPSIDIDVCLPLPFVVLLD